MSKKYNVVTVEHDKNKESWNCCIKNGQLRCACKKTACDIWCELGLMKSDVWFVKWNWKLEQFMRKLIYQIGI